MSMQRSRHSTPRWVPTNDIGTMWELRNWRDRVLFRVHWDAHGNWFTPWNAHYVCCNTSSRHHKLADAVQGAVYRVQNCEKCARKAFVYGTGN